MEKIKVKIKLYSKEFHLSQVLTGFLMLEDRGIIDLSFVEPKDVSSRPCPCFIEADINGHIVGYDAMDGYNCYNNLDEYLMHVDAYFKRSYSEKLNNKLANGYKIKPLGLSYRVHHPRLPITPPQPTTILNYGIDLIKRLTGRDYRFYSNFFEYQPSYNPQNSPKILFSTRLWKPDGEDDEDIVDETVIEERMAINEMRVNLIRTLTKEFGKFFKGCVSPSKYAYGVCPDIIAPETFCRRDNYIRNMHKFDICIGSAGLHQSIGWKIGEYVAASKCIVSESFAYTAPEFLPRRNYLPFDNMNQCVATIESLINDKSQIREMEEANYEYYNNHLRPDALIWNSIEQVLK